MFNVITIGWHARGQIELKLTQTVSRKKVECDNNRFLRVMSNY